MNIESVLSVMARAGIVMGMESVVESWVSKTVISWGLLKRS
jgi:hypothetical protein